ncbi:uncharacterized protein V1516DRAFT_669067 [Lipomyces oligophaga]|uniref:uncharacterized protein n=1 Tax=Lipomyces oligophaga TaxID=45792 RepID=UPI0034CF4988
MVLQGHEFLCQIPTAKPIEDQGYSNKVLSRTEEEKELRRAAISGWNLLEPLNGSCLYYIAGWWTYSFCHKVGVKQFHQEALQKGITHYPPKEDRNFVSYYLGQVPVQNQASEHFDHADDGKPLKNNLLSSEVSADDISVQTSGEVRYLVQKIGKGTLCDLTDRERKIEIQFHCNPNSQDKIEWIKEVTTCRYLMVIHTPRLCQDPAFLPQKKDMANEIQCRKIATKEEIEKKSEQDRLEEDILKAMADHEISEVQDPNVKQYHPRGGVIKKKNNNQAKKLYKDIDEKIESLMFKQGLVHTTEELNEMSGPVPTDPVRADETVEIKDTREDHMDDEKEETEGLDLIASVKILIRHLEEQIADGTFRAPNGEIATAEDSFSYMIALENVSGEVIGVVSLYVEGGTVRVILEDKLNFKPTLERDLVTNPLPQKMLDDLREFSGGLKLGEVFYSDIEENNDEQDNNKQGQVDESNEEQVSKESLMGNGDGDSDQVVFIYE